MRYDMKKQILSILTITLSSQFAFAAGETKKPVSEGLADMVNKQNAELRSMFPHERSESADTIQYATIGMEVWAYRRIVTGKGVLTRIPGYRALTGALQDWASMSVNSRHAGLAEKAVKIPIAAAGKPFYYVVRKADSILKYYIVFETVGRIYVWRVVGKDPEFFPGAEIAVKGVDASAGMVRPAIDKLVGLVDQLTADIPEEPVGGGQQ